MSEPQSLNCKRRYTQLLEKWRKEYSIATNGKKLFNTEFADTLRMSRENFQRLINRDNIDIEAYENLLARYILWRFATKMGCDPIESLTVFENERNHMYYIEQYGEMVNQSLMLNDSGQGDYKKNPAPLRMPDLLTLRKQIESALFSLQEAKKTLGEPLGPETSAVGDPAFQQPGKKEKI